MDAEGLSPLRVHFGEALGSPGSEAFASPMEEDLDVTADGEHSGQNFWAQ